MDGVIAWQFLVDDQDASAGVAQHPLVADRARRPWLVVSECPGPFGIERFAVPRLMSQCEWPDEAAMDEWHESAWAGTAAAIPTAETPFDARAAEPRRRGRPSNTPPVLGRALAVTVECDLRGRAPSTMADNLKPQRQLQPLKDVARSAVRAELDRRRRDEETPHRTTRRDRQKCRTTLWQYGGLPWAAFPSGGLPARWWEAQEFAAALARWEWHASLLAYRHKWEQRTPVLSPAEQVVYVFLRLDGQSLRPETLALARSALEADARASDAFDVVQWVARLESAARPGCVDPHQLMFDFPELPQAWSKARGDGETQRQGAF